MQKLELEFDGLTPQAVVELINMGMAKAEYVEGKVVIKPVDLSKEEKIVEHVRNIPPEKFTGYLVETDGFDELTARVFEHSIQQFGFVYPVIAIKSIDGYTVVDGRKRVELAKKLKIPVPTIVRDYDEVLGLIAHIAANFARKQLTIPDLAKIFKQIDKKGFLPLLRELLGFKTTEIFAIMDSERHKKVVEKLRYRPPSVTVEVAKVAVRDEEKAERMAEEINRRDADSVKEVKEIKEKVENELKKGIYCALCGEPLNKETVNWIAVCSSCKYSLYEELKQVIIDEKIKCFVTGKRFYGDEIVTVSKDVFREILQDIPEDVRISHRWQGVLERLEG